MMTASKPNTPVGKARRRVELAEQHLWAAAGYLPDDHPQIKAIGKLIVGTKMLHSRLT
jgi:hypothetical protein